MDVAQRAWRLIPSWCATNLPGMHKLHALRVSALLLALVTSPLSRADQLAAGAPRNTYDLDETWLTGVNQLTSFTFLPDGRALITQKSGEFRIRETDGTVKTITTFSVDTESEKGLLAALPHPDFATSNRVIVYRSRSNSDGGTDSNRHRVSSFVLTRDMGGNYGLEPGSEVILVENLLGPANHDGGGLSMGPDGFLYVGTGDTGCNETPPSPPALHRNLLGTSFNHANGAVLRVSLDGTIPMSNPWVNDTNVSGVPSNPLSCTRVSGSAVPATMSAARGELWALGFRNAFRVWADPRTGFIWVGDVGEGRYEEVNVVTQGGRHFGWPFIEGPATASSWPVGKCSELSPNPGDCTPPAYFCRHTSCSGCVEADTGCNSITGGRIMDACEHPETFRGRYFFADNVTRNMWTLDVTEARDGVVPMSRRDFASFDAVPTHIEEGPDGAIYVSVASFQGGAARVVRISPKVPATCMTASSSSSAGMSSSSSAMGASSAAAASSMMSAASSAVVAASSSAAASGTSSSVATSSGTSTGTSTATSTATSAASSAGSGSGANASSGTNASGTSGTDDGGDDNQDDSCGCEATTAVRAPWALLAMLALVRVRRPAR